MSKGSILVVEDETIVALDIQSRLRRLGYSVAGHATSGRQALDLAQSQRPDLVLMDVMLEGSALDGIDTAHEIREHLNIPIVYLTAYADPHTLERAKLTGPLGYLTKPFADHELALTIELALFKHQAECELQAKERLLSTTLGNLAEAVLTTDAQGRVTYLNPAAQALLLVTPQAAHGLELLSLFSILEEDTRLPISALEEICPPVGASPLCEDMLLVTPSGQEVPVAVSVSPIQGPQGAFHGRVMVVRNVSLKKQAEAELRAGMETLRSTFRQTVRALSSMAEKRDPYTAGHQQRVARLACAVGRELGLPPDAMEGLEVAGILHDIGKIYVPAEILSKPARLSHMEMGIMKTHSEVGYEILREVDFPWPVARAVMEHHERMDGTGYPGGLKGADICLEARILAVADVTEAMSSHRPYRASLGLDSALEEIATGRGGRYDPDAADACLSLLREGRFEFEDACGQPPAGEAERRGGLRSMVRRDSHSQVAPNQVAPSQATAIPAGEE